MANEIKLELNQAVSLTYKDTEINIATDRGYLGTLLISQGSVQFLPPKHSVNGYELSWEELTQLLITHGKPAKIRTCKSRPN